jgi:hypothetical protein
MDLAWVLLFQTQVGKQAIAKKGKMSGAKEVFFCPSCKRRSVLVRGVHSLECSCGGRMKSVFRKYLKNGMETYKTYPQARKIRSHLLHSLLSFTSG